MFKRGNGVYEGYSVAVLKYISKKLKFKYTIREPVDKTYGCLSANGTWSGMIGEVARGVSKFIRVLGGKRVNQPTEF